MATGTLNGMKSISKCRYTIYRKKSEKKDIKLIKNQTEYSIIVLIKVIAYEEFIYTTN